MKILKYFKVQTLKGDELLFSDEIKCRNYCKNRGDWCSDLTYSSFTILIDDLGKTYTCSETNSEHINAKIKKAEVISKLSNEDLKIMGY